MICCRHAGRIEDEDEDEDDTRIFRSANPKQPLPPQYAFLEHNHRVRQKIETWQTRVRRHDLAIWTKRCLIFTHSASRTSPSVHELNRLIRDCGGPEFLCATRSGFDRRTGIELRRRGVSRCRAAGRATRRAGLCLHAGRGTGRRDGEARFQPRANHFAGQRGMGGARPARRSDQRAAARAAQKHPPRTDAVSAESRRNCARTSSPTGDSLRAGSRGVYSPALRRRPFRQTPGPADAVPAHLRPRIEVIGHDQKSLGTSRDLGQLRQKLEQTKAKPAPDDSAWQPRRAAMGTIRLERMDISAICRNASPSAKTARCRFMPGPACRRRTAA